MADGFMTVTHKKNVGCSQMGCTYSSSITVAHKIPIVGRLHQHAAELLVSKHHLDGHIIIIIIMDISMAHDP